MNGANGEGSKIRAEHLALSAFVYVRQSSLRPGSMENSFPIWESPFAIRSLSRITHQKIKQRLSQE